MLGAPVDEVVDLGAGIGDVVIARVEEVRQHPNADRLRICTVNAGGDARLQVVCGAPNVEAGGVYPFAPIGATLPGGMEIKKAKLRGEESQGMLCSARELGLGARPQRADGAQRRLRARRQLPAVAGAGRLAARRGRDAQPRRAALAPGRGARAGPARRGRHRAAEVPRRPRPRLSGEARQARGGRAGRGGRHRGRGGLPAVHGRRRSRGVRAPVAGVAGHAAARHRPAAHQQRCGCHQLRAARAGAAHPRLRPGPAARRPRRRAPRARRRDADDAGRRGARAAGDGRRHRGRRARRGPGGRDGRAEQRGGRGDDGPVHRGRALRSEGGAQDGAAAGAEHGRVAPLRAQRGPRGAAHGHAPRHRAHPGRGRRGGGGRRGPGAAPLRAARHRAARGARGEGAGHRPDARGDPRPAGAHRLRGQHQAQAHPRAGPRLSPGRGGRDRPHRGDRPPARLRLVPRAAAPVPPDCRSGAPGRRGGAADAARSSSAGDSWSPSRPASRRRAPAPCPC